MAMQKEKRKSNYVILAFLAAAFIYFVWRAFAG